MRLLNEALEKRFAQVGRQENVADPLVIARFFNPSGAGSWYATEYIPEERVFFGYAEVLEGEWGYFSLDELEAFQGAFNLGIERDLGWEEKTVSQVNSYFGKSVIH